MKYYKRWGIRDLFSRQPKPLYRYIQVDHNDYIIRSINTIDRWWSPLIVRPDHLDDYGDDWIPVTPLEIVVQFGSEPQ